MASFDPPATDDFLELHERSLVECTDASFEDMFQSAQIDNDAMHRKTPPLHSRQRNNFYDIRACDLNGIYDIVVLDGPHGNGRSIAFLHLKNRLSASSTVLIDDHSHYDFETRMLGQFKAELEFEIRYGKPTRWEKLVTRLFNQKNDLLSQWNRGGDFVIYRIQ